MIHVSLKVGLTKPLCWTISAGVLWELSYLIAQHGSLAFVTLMLARFLRAIVHNIYRCFCRFIYANCRASQSRIFATTAGVL